MIKTFSSAVAKLTRREFYTLMAFFAVVSFFVNIALGIIF